MLYKFLGRLLSLMLGLAMMSSCAQATPTKLAVPSLSPSPNPTTTAIFLDARERFARIEPGQSTEAQVREILGKPEVEQTFRGRVQWWYNPPRGWVILRDGIVIEKSVLPQNLGDVVIQYGAPDKVILHIAKDVQHNMDVSVTFLLYRQHNQVLGIEGELYSFTSDMRVGGAHLAPEYFDEYVHQQGLDGSSEIGEIKVIAWPGLSVTPTP